MTAKMTLAERLRANSGFMPPVGLLEEAADALDLAAKALEPFAKASADVGTKPSPARQLRHCVHFDQVNSLKVSDLRAAATAHAALQPAEGK